MRKKIIKTLEAFIELGMFLAVILLFLCEELKYGLIVWFMIWYMGRLWGTFNFKESK